MSADSPSPAAVAAEDPEHVRPHRGRSVIGPAVGLAAGIAVLLLAQTIPLPSVEGDISPRWWPQVAGGAMIVFSAVALARGGLRPEADLDRPEPRQPQGAVRIVLTFAAVAVYGLLWQFFDFRLVTFLLVAGLVAVGGGRGWKSLLLFPLIVMLVLWGLFGVLLRVPL